MRHIFRIAIDKNEQKYQRAFSNILGISDPTDIVDICRACHRKVQLAGKYQQVFVKMVVLKVAEISRKIFVLLSDLNKVA